MICSLRSAWSSPSSSWKRRISRRVATYAELGAEREADDSHVGCRATLIVCLRPSVKTTIRSALPSLSVSLMTRTRSVGWPLYPSGGKCVLLSIAQTRPLESISMPVGVTICGCSAKRTIFTGESSQRGGASCAVALEQAPEIAVARSSHDAERRKVHRQTGEGV